MTVKINSLSNPQLPRVSSEPAARAPRSTSSSQPALTPAQKRDDDFEPSTPRGNALHGAGHDSGKGLNGTSGTLRSASGRIPADAWQHPEQLVGHLTQNPASGSLGNSRARCGPSALLGTALMQGKEPAARFLEGVATGAAGTRLTADEKRALTHIARDIRAGHATYEQLSRAQDLLYRAGNSRGDVEALLQRTLAKMPRGAERRELTTLLTQLQAGAWQTSDATRAQALIKRATGQDVSINLVPDPQRPDDASAQYFSYEVAGSRQVGVDRSGFDDEEIDGLAKLGGATTRTLQLDASARVQDLFAQLKPGETITIRVGGTDDDTNSDHFVSIGRRADGTAFIYNPDPARHDYTLFTGSKTDPQPATFAAELEKYNLRLSIDRDNDMPRATISSFPG